ncbi:aminotransferase class I/II-fold pyridoxal phosphate-dependent enzyme [Occultella glacieicola]|uniref:Aminotransferase class I/II-fold pyridoxal phosphate-dependent enzyme n=1 Tax=Occultella glacieicola TaxID=2518684 RepID=A0ABY2EDJ9_9MICO|nr:histidinol-phosphate transaminase [Occultella glacieicola]TDE98947.1 aminotransferase class I/II-fold pyridoxal phosphate-dependent enzyme [Occultella glacieicola]
MASRIPGPPAFDAPAPPPEAPPVRLRKELLDLPAHVPGAVGATAAVFKLSANELPFPPLPAVIAAIHDAAEDVNRYPQVYGARLLRAIASHHGVVEDQVLIGNGAVALAELLIRSTCAPGDEVVHPWRCFEAYPAVARASGAVGVPVPLSPDGSHDLAAMAVAVTDRTRVIVVATPADPTGASLTHTDLLAFLEVVPSDVMVILDESYVQFDRTADAIDSRALLPVHKNVVVLRTFSNAYGLAGLRIGYALARRRLVRVLRRVSTPFGVSDLGQVAAMAALGQTALVESRVAELVAERDRVVAALRSQGWDVGDPQGNFYWLPLGEHSSLFAKDAVQSGITVRPFPGEGVRISIGEPEANDIALAVASRWVHRRTGRGDE